MSAKQQLKQHLQSESKSKSEKEESLPDPTNDIEDAPAECPVCLQTFVHPVRLPCRHVFCFLCVKGAANQSKRCALCRAVIPPEYFNNPELLRREDLERESQHSVGYQWYYEGRNGWWQYDERTSKELECRYLDTNAEKTFDLLIAGFLYVVDLNNMVQIRRNDHSRRRRMKRDLATVPKKGVAGLKVAVSDTAPDTSRVVVGGQDASDPTTIAPRSVSPPPSTASVSLAARSPITSDTGTTDRDLSSRMHGIALDDDFDVSGQVQDGSSPQDSAESSSYDTSEDEDDTNEITNL